MKYSVKRHAVTQPDDPSYRLIPLTQGQNALVDTDDYEWLMQWNWGAHWNSNTISFYAYRSNDWRDMHRLIIDCAAGQLCDHRNHNTLDNRRFNLRACTHSQNGANSRSKKSSKPTKLKGIHKVENRWRASIMVQRKAIYLGRYADEQEAARAYDAAALKHFGEFACLNFPLNAFPKT